MEWIHHSEQFGCFPMSSLEDAAVQAVIEGRLRQMYDGERYRKTRPFVMFRRKK